MKSPQFDTPILLIAFNRPELTKQILHRIKEINPNELYVYLDGPRENNENDKARQEDIINIIREIGWNDCNLNVNNNDLNLGCGKGPETAITWFFDNVQEGIILEDDCLPDISFFSFCEETLSKYRTDTRVMHISGSYLFNEYHQEDSYYFSIFPGSWGWATWKRSWNLFDRDMSEFLNFKKLKLIKNIVDDTEFASFLQNRFELIYENPDLDIWDYKWQFTVISNNGLALIPTTNLVKNIGFGENSTHTHTEHPLYKKIALNYIEFPLKHPDFVICNKTLDSKFYRKWHHQGKHKILTRVRYYANMIRRQLKKYNG